MKNTLELLDDKNLLKVRATELISNAEKETRKLNDLENTQFDEITKELATIDAEIRKIEEDNKRNLNKVTTKQTKQTMENFSLLKAINDVANNRQLDERALEITNAGQAEFRKAGQNTQGQIVLPMETRATISATVATAGQEVVAEDKLGILEPLRANLVMVQAGATYMTGLTGTVSIPAYSGSNVL
jgi:HK97 family phage major capsid protein